MNTPLWIQFTLAAICGFAGLATVTVLSAVAIALGAKVSSFEYSFYGGLGTMLGILHFMSLQAQFLCNKWYEDGAKEYRHRLYSHLQNYLFYK